MKLNKQTKTKSKTEYVVKSSGKEYVFESFFLGTKKLKTK